MARTSLIAANLPSNLLPWVFRHSVWIFNRCLHDGAKQTPFEILGHRKPDMTLLRVFGAKSFIFNHTLRKDFSPRAITGFHLGVSEDSKGWVFGVPEKRMVIKSASVTFDESIFFLDDKHAHIKSIQTSNLFDDSMICEIKRQEDLIDKLLKTMNTDSTIPMTYKEAMTSRELIEWSSAIQE
ncbi:hypothetical protein O181_109237 [Austropuccinia psidii MF-1]|uniref:Retroviral polymerase SH3-like domain-containing protein n=1 Tax=Austropuccinia psidii MF-1 TaxID=1389203 RepID=A0A9Q3JXG9_9BASI|nr:hypothetical protein [Austropuccinia psidii MF-1]